MHVVPSRSRRAARPAGRNLGRRREQGQDAAATARARRRSGRAGRAAKEDGHALSPYQFDKKIEKAIDEYVRPMLSNDGGDVEIVDIKDTLVYCRLTGACQGCAGAGQTLRMLVEQTLKEMVDERIRVIGVDEEASMKIIYADNNATTQVAPEVVEAMTPFLTAEYFNPSSMYEPAKPAARAIAQARKEIARHFGLADPQQILFTACATESNNTAIFGAAKANPNRRHVITTAVEHPAVLEVCKELKRDGYDVTFLGVDGDGNLDVGEFIRALAARHAAGEHHARQQRDRRRSFPIEQLSRLTKETDPSIIFHTDATQSVGKVADRPAARVPARGLCCRFPATSSMPRRGSAALYIKRGTRCRPFLIGGHQEEGRRAGTENVPYIVGMAKALQMAAEGLSRTKTRGCAAFAIVWRRRLSSGFPTCEVNGRGAPGCPTR